MGEDHFRDAVERDGQWTGNSSLRCRHSVQLMSLKAGSHQPRAGRGRQAKACPASRGGFSLFELTIVILIIGIVAAMMLPAVGTNYTSSRLSSAANVLASDIEFCASECITHPSNARAIVFDLTNNNYTVEVYATATASDASGGPASRSSMILRPGGTRLTGVTITKIVVGSGTMTTLAFDAYGRPTITADMVITLSYAGNTQTVTVKKGTGEVSIP